MKFCKECENMLSPVEEDNKLWNKCQDCGFRDENHDSVIDQKDYKMKQTVVADNNKYIVNDNALARTTLKPCPNKACISHDKPNLQEAVFIQDKQTVKLTFICVHCNTEWKYS